MRLQGVRLPKYLNRNVYRKINNLLMCTHDAIYCESVSYTLRALVQTCSIDKKYINLKYQGSEYQGLTYVECSALNPLLHNIAF